MTSVTAGTVKKRSATGGLSLRTLLEWGGVAAGVILIAFGVAALVLGVNGRNTVGHELKLQQITGSGDMTPAAIKSEIAAAGLKNVQDVPTCNVAGKAIDTGTEARCFASYMRIHALEATGGVPYALMPRYASADGKGTNDAAKAVQKDGRPVDNAARDIWINETALSSALNMSYMAEQTALFGIVVGVALLLSGIGFTVLALGGALRHHRETKA